MKKRAASLVLGVVLCVGGCSSRSNTSATRQDNPNIVQVENSDAEINAATAKARATLPQFLAALRSPKKSQNTFLVKKRFPYGNDGSGEHMWINKLRYDGQLFHGILDDVPEDVSTVRHGDKVTVTSSELSDWMYVEDGKLVGGTTVRVLLNRLSPVERKQFLRAGHFRID